MAGSVNKVIIVGNLGKDPEIRKTQDGKPIANLSIATSDVWKDKATGERKERTEWHRVVIFSEGLAKVAEQYLKKGSKVYIEGALQTRKWTDKDAIERYSTEITLNGFNCSLTLLDKAERPPQSPDDYGTARTSSDDKSDWSPPRDAAGKRTDIDDEIPF